MASVPQVLELQFFTILPQFAHLLSLVCQRRISREASSFAATPLRGKDFFFFFLACNLTWNIEPDIANKEHVSLAHPRKLQGWRPQTAFYSSLCAVCISTVKLSRCSANI